MINSLEACLDEVFALPRKDFSQYSPLTLAYIGDAVYDLVIRTVLVKRSNKQTAKLHHEASGFVRAGAQAAMLDTLQPHLTDEEKAICRRGYNASPGHTARNASREEYLQATAFETLVGYLYLQGEYQRLVSLIRTGLEPAAGTGPDKKQKENS